MVFTLSIDTCLNGGSAALFEDGAEIAACDILTASKGDSPPLFKIEELLAENELGFGTLDVIVVTRGPGSFTGVRTGLSIVRGLLRARQIIYLSCTVMEALTEMTGGEIETCRTAIYAGKSEAAVQDFECSGTGLRSVGRHFLLNREELFENLDGPIVLGRGLADSLISENRKLKGKGVIIAEPNIARLAFRFVEKAAEGSLSDGLDPVYTRDFVAGRS